MFQCKSFFSEIFQFFLKIFSFKLFRMKVFSFFSPKYFFSKSFSKIFLPETTKNVKKGKIYCRKIDRRPNNGRTVCPLRGGFFLQKNTTCRRNYLAVIHALKPSGCAHADCSGQPLHTRWRWQKASGWRAPRGLRPQGQGEGED